MLKMHVKDVSSAAAKIVFFFFPEKPGISALQEVNVSYQFWAVGLYTFRQIQFSTL